MDRIQIIGLSGTNGAGKDTVGEILAERYGYLFISVTELLRDEARRRGLPVERQYLRQISAEWRRESGLGVLVERAVRAYQSKKDGYKGVVMASLRNPAEADLVHELGGIILWIDADPKLRYDRIQANATSRDRSGEDCKSFEQFLAEEAAEMHPAEGSDAAALNTAAVKERADYTIFNETSNIDFLEGELKRLLSLG